MFAECFWMFKYYLRSLYQDIVNIPRNINKWIIFWNDYQNYRKLSSSAIELKLEYLYPCLGDNISETIIDPIYFYQDIWAFEKIIQNQPIFHVDVGSHHKFVAFLSKIIPVTMVDIRPLSLPLNSIKFLEGSILNLPFDDGSISSLSSLCVIEHIGLGRYGDPLDPKGTEKAIEELKRVIAFEGNIYVSFPVDVENRVYFNAHRSFDEDYIIKLFDPLVVKEKRYIYNKKFTNIRENGFGIGCYHFQKLTR